MWINPGIWRNRSLWNNTGPFSLLINKVNPYTYDFEALTWLRLEQTRVAEVAG